MPINTFTNTDLFNRLTREERLRVEQFQARRPEQLPRFFNAGTQRVGEEPNELISREFEAYLILQSLAGPDKLSNAIAWFTEAADLQIVRDDRNALLADAFELEQGDTLNRAQEIRRRVDRFSKFREQFEIVEVGADEDSKDFPVDRFSQTVPEFGLIMRDSQAAMGEISSKQTRVEHLLVHDEVVNRDRLTRRRLEVTIGSIDDDRIAAELLSWRDVISEMQARVKGAQ